MSDLLHQDAADLAGDAKRLLLELDEAVPGARGAAAECRPTLDVLETATTLEVVVDLPGVAADALRVVIRRNTVLVVGVKLPGPPDTAGRFHLAERSYGRFARAVRLNGAFDATRARATAAGGLLRVILPRIDERRGQAMAVPVERG